MTAWTARLTERGRSVLEFLRRPRVRRLLGGAIVVVALGFLVSVLVGGWVQIQPYLAQMDLRFALAGQLFTLVAFLLGGVVWYCVQRSHGIPTTLRRSLAVHLTSNATKYIPGYGWHYMSKAYLSRDSGARPRTVASAMAVEVGAVLGAGAVIAALLGLTMSRQWALEWTLPDWFWALIGLGITAALSAVTLFLPRLVIPAGDATGIDGSPRAGAQTSRGWMMLTIAVAVIGWLLYAVSTWLFARALYPVPLTGFWQCLFALTVGGVVSLLVIVVPVGLGVREATMSLLLVGLLPLSLAVVVSIVTRLSVVLSELLGLSVVTWLDPSLPERKQADTPNGVSAKIHQNRD